MSDRPALVPAAWEPLGHTIGPFGPDDLEVREYQEDPSHPLRKWQVRIAARPGVVSTGRASAHQQPPVDLSRAQDIKGAIAFQLALRVSRSFDKEKDRLPETFVF